MLLKFWSYRLLHGVFQLCSDLSEYVSASFFRVTKFRSIEQFICGPGYSSRYSDSLRAGQSGDRIPEGAKISAHVKTGPGAHPASCTVGTGSFPGVKRPGRGVDYPTPSSAEVKERV